MIDERLQDYVRQLFAPEDRVLTGIREAHKREDLPSIHISPEEGKLLYVLLKLAQARRVLEIGTLGGYSGTWMARALPSDGQLVTIEKDPKHAAVARRAFADAGLSDRVRLIEGAALEVLPTLTPGFDAVFVDADKPPMGRYYEEAVRLLRVGGLLLCDNAFIDGRVADQADRKPDVEGVRECNRLAAADPRIVATIVPERDGL